MKSLECECGLRAAADRIINGTDADRHEYPWQVGLTKTGKRTFCGGVLISSCHVLTAAHCVEDWTSEAANEDKLYVALADHDHTSQDGTEVM